MSTSYRNFRHKPGKPEYGPAVYVTDARPTFYRGYAIFQRIAGMWDVVRDGECVGQYVSPNGARRFIDALTEGSR